LHLSCNLVSGLKRAARSRLRGAGPFSPEILSFSTACDCFEMVAHRLGARRSGTPGNALLNLTAHK
jgi:hypothetical protein